ncbi:hypothetical protein [Phytohabitans kaempferiae]|uniref:Exo-alpha-sialidase n=1 Tax=Phytohabitans kaempferiae TaxID=1620943 RepID=A0ABV6M465_9ACTN
MSRSGWRRVGAALCAVAVLLALAAAPAAAANDIYVLPPTKKLDSCASTSAPWCPTGSPNGYDYGYAPSIVYDGSQYYTLYCSSPDSTSPGYPYDTIRFSASADGNTWIAPSVKLRVTDTRDTATVKYEGAACDPSVVRYDAGDGAGPMYYMFYTGVDTANGYNDVIFVARSSTYGGTYAKWTGSGWSTSSTAQPAAVILPKAQRPAGFLGAAQSSVVVIDGVLLMWYTDDTATSTPTRRIYYTASADPTVWPASTMTDVMGDSVDVKYDPSRGQFVMYQIRDPHTDHASLVRYFSDLGDGLDWDEQIVCGTTCFPPYTHNIGVSGDVIGWVNDDKTLLMFGIPYDGATTDDWGHWDMYGTWMI